MTRRPATFRLTLASLTAALFLGGCVSAMQGGQRAADSLTLCVSPRVAPAPSFRAELAERYDDYARFETEPLYDATDRDFYHGKAARARRGVDVQPEDPHDWNVATPELANAPTTCCRSPSSPTA